MRRAVLIAGITLLALLCISVILQPDVSPRSVAVQDTNGTAEGRVSTVPELSPGFIVLPVLGALLLLKIRDSKAS